MCKEGCVCVCVAVNSHACYIWIVNDITDSNTCFFSVAGFFLFQKSMCKEVCVSVCVSAVNSPACYIWIVNDITDANTCLFQFCFSSSFLLFWSSMCKVVLCVREYVCAFT